MAGRAPSEPHEIRKGEYWEPEDLVFTFKDSVDIKLFEADTIGSDDRIGRVQMLDKGSPYKKTVKFNGDSSHYKVVLEYAPKTTARAKPKPREFDSKGLPRTCGYYNATGDGQTINGNTSQAFLGESLDDNILAFIVPSPSCKVQVFEHSEFQGESIFVTKGRGHSVSVAPFSRGRRGMKIVPSEWKKRISSFKCLCD